MNTIFKVGNIIEERADGLVCSGNVQMKPKSDIDQSEVASDYGRPA